MQAARDQIQIVLVAALGGEVKIPVKTLDTYPIGRGLQLKVVDGELFLVLVETPNIVEPELEGVVSELSAIVN
jgi:hypothetical protein